MMLRNTAFPFLLLFFFLGLSACGGSMTPGEQEKAAGKAQDSGNYQKALDLYQGLVDWKGEGTIDPDLRFKAALESVKCLVEIGRFEKAVEDFKALEKTFPEKMKAPKAYNYALSVCNALVRKEAGIKITAGLLKYAGEKYPDYKDRFEANIEDLKKRAKTPEDIQALKTLGYL